MTAPGFDKWSAVSEDQDEAGSQRRMRRAALICYRRTQTGQITAEWTYWPSAGQSRQAAAELTPCGPLCIGVHSIARLDLLPEPRRRAGRGRPVTAGNARAGGVSP